MIICGNISRWTYCKNKPLEVVIVTEYEQNAFDHLYKILMHLPFSLCLGAGHGCHPIWYHTIVVSQQLFSYYTIFSDREFSRFQPCHYSVYSILTLR